MENTFHPFKPPFKYDNHGQMIFDRDNKLMLDVRGWGHIQYLRNPEKTQDDFGLQVVKALNNYESLLELAIYIRDSQEEDVATYLETIKQKTIHAINIPNIPQKPSF